MIQAEPPVIENDIVALDFLTVLVIIKCLAAELFRHVPQRDVAARIIDVRIIGLLIGEHVDERVAVIGILNEQRTTIGGSIDAANELRAAFS